MTPKKLCVPAVLLTLAAISPLINIPGVPAADAAPAPGFVPAAAVIPAPTPTRAVVPAVAVRPATTAFAHGVPGLSPQVLTMALQAVSSARSRGFSGRDDLLTVID